MRKRNKRNYEQRKWLVTSKQRKENNKLKETNLNKKYIQPKEVKAKLIKE